MAAILHHADCRAHMATMADASVDSVCTDPPYELGFMGRDWDRSGIAYDVAMWAEVLRVLKPGGWLVAFSHARTYHRMACAIEDAGFEIRDQIMWIYGSGFPKGGNRDGRGTCLKPAHEPIVLARKPFAGSVAANEQRFGTGALNIDACRVGTDSTIRVKSGGRNDFPHEDDSWTPRAVQVGSENGRWPANIVHDGSDGVVAAFPQAPGQLRAVGPEHGAKASVNVYGDFGPRDHFEPRGDAGSAARFFYCAKASKADRDEGLDQFEPQDFVQFQTGNGESGKASSLSEGRATQYRNTHETVKPTALMRWLVRLVTPRGGLVFDPFTGSGSTGKAAVLERFNFIGCELTEKYIPIARARIAAAERQVADARDLFSEAAA